MCSKPTAKSQDYHDAIKNVVEHLKTKRNELLTEINNDELEKAKVLGEMDKLKDKLSILDANLKKKSEFRKDYDKAICQSEGHFVELMQKSEDFLMRARREALALCHAVGEKSSYDSKESERRTEKCLAMQGPQGHQAPQAPQAQPPPPQKKSEGNCAPAAVIAIQPPESGNCVGCSNNFNCTTIAVPYRANGL